MPRIARWITLLAACGLIPVGSAFAAEPEPPTVTFVWSGAAPTCGSLPDVRTLTMTPGTQLLVVNATGVDATVVVGDEDVLEVPADGGALLTLSPGEHAVTMVPACQLRSAIGELTVTVTAGVEPTDPQSADAPNSRGASAGELPVHAPAATSAIAPVATPTRLSRSGTSAAARPAVAAADPSAGWRDIAATPVDLSRDEPQHLVTAVALILLLGLIMGVGKAVIRSRRTEGIKHQRTAQRAVDQRTPQPYTDEAPESADDLRDRLRELIQAAHQGADPRKVEAARRELFAQLPHPDQHTGT